MEAVNAPHLPEELVRAYEALRAQATGELPTMTPRGLALFLAVGFPDWMNAWTPPPALTTPIAAGQRPSSVDFGGDVVELLADMGLSCQRRWATR